MVIDLILDRRCGDVYEDETGARMVRWDGSPDEYDPREFYHDVMCYQNDEISRAMDFGTEESVKAALCRYVIGNGYNPAVCGYVWSVNWLENSRVKDEEGNVVKMSPLYDGEPGPWDAGKKSA